MCRLAAYHGPSTPLSALLYDPPTSLSDLAWRPRELLHGNVNVDGTGVAWWPIAGEGRPLRYVTSSTPWADANLPGLAPRLHAQVALAAVRGATPGVPFGAGNVAPFTHDDLAFSHNGWLGGFRKQTGRALTALLPDDLYGAIDAISDSLTVFLSIVAARQAGAPDLPAAVRHGLTTVADVLADLGETATLNTVTTDGTTIVATRTSVGQETNSLYVVEDAARWPGATILASEPLDDDPAWHPVPPHHLVTIDASGVRTEEFDPTRP